MTGELVAGDRVEYLQAVRKNVVHWRRAVYVRPIPRSEYVWIDAELGARVGRRRIRVKAENLRRAES